MPFFSTSAMIDGGDEPIQEPAPVKTSIPKEDSDAAARAKQNTAVTGTGFTTNKNLLAAMELQAQLDSLKEQAAADAKKKADDLAQAQADAAAARQAKMDALKATREAKYFANQTAAKIADTKSLGFEGIKPPDPEPDDNYNYHYVWRSDVGGGGSGHWALVRTPRYKPVSKPDTIVSKPDTTTVSSGGVQLGTSLLPSSEYTPPPPATPPVPPAPPPPPPPPPKTAPIDTILFDDESVPIEIMSDLIFENIGGHELINIARSDTINGQTVSYQPIKNLTSIQQQYNPNNVVALQNTSDKYFANFSIKLETKLPEEGEGTGPDGAYVYIEDTTGDLIIELINLEPDEQIEVQVSLSGTIYEAEFNES